MAEHSDIALKGTTPTGETRTAERPSLPAPDSTLILLQQQRARLEAKIAEARQAPPPSPADDNPYDPPADEDELANDEKMLAQVKVAIAARQNATARAQAAARPASNDTSKSSAAAPASSNGAALRAEWQRLVAAVVDAQHAPEPKAVSPASAVTVPALRITAPASLASKPLRPNRPLFALVGLLIGAWLAVLWTVTRVALNHDVPRVRVASGERAAHAQATRPSNPVVVPEVIASQARAAADRAALTSSVPLPPARPPGGAGGFWRAPMKLRVDVTQPGVVDVKTVLEHTGSTAASIRPNPPADLPVPISSGGWRAKSDPPGRAVATTRTFASPTPPRPPPPSDPPRQQGSFRAPHRTRTGWWDGFTRPSDGRGVDVQRCAGGMVPRSVAGQELS